VHVDDDEVEVEGEFSFEPIGPVRLEKFVFGLPVQVITESADGVLNPPADGGGVTDIELLL
jgi:hypothetical protein